MMKQLAKSILLLSLMLVISIHVNAQTKKPAAATPKAKEENKAVAFKAPVMPVDDSDSDPLTVAEQMPSFPGGSVAQKEWIEVNLKYPEKAKEAQLEGRVVIRMVVKKDGSLTDFQIMRKFDNDCMAEAVRLLENMPTWIPGKHQGQDVDVFYTIPIVFKIAK